MAESFSSLSKSFSSLDGNFPVFCDSVRHPRAVVGLASGYPRAVVRPTSRCPRAVSDSGLRVCLFKNGFLRNYSAWLWLGRGMSRPDAR
jgi:hypothetical protein